jgi:hypothetical protein
MSKTTKFGKKNTRNFRGIHSLGITGGGKLIRNIYGNPNSS